MLLTVLQELFLSQLIDVLAMVRISICDSDHVPQSDDYECLYYDSDESSDADF